MKFRRARAGLGLVLSGTLLLAACTSDDPQGTGTNNASDAKQQMDGGDPCLGDVGITETKDGEVRYTAGPGNWSGYNTVTDATYSTYNSTVSAHMFSGFWYYGADGTICRDEEFGKFEVTSEDPLVVEYTINDEAVWSDGTPVTINDYLMDWATQNPEFVAPGLHNKKDPAAKPVFNHVSATFAEDVLEGPQGELGSKSFKVEYTEPNPDYQIIIGSALPEHVIAKKMGLQPGDLAKAVLARDAETVKAAATHWNEGWIFQPGQLPDASETPSSGPYMIKPGSWQAGNSLTLTANPEYWGTPPATRDLVFRFIDDAQQVSSLGNGDVQVIQPQATVDTLGQLEGLGSAVKTDTGQSMTWEHLDFNFRENNVFGNPETGHKLREAFAYCVPRQTIVDSLIKPIAADAVMMNAREVLPFQENYDEVVKDSYDGRYDEVKIDEAKKLVEEAGVPTPIDVRLGYKSGSQRRTETVAAIASSCKEAGFNVIDSNSEKFFDEVLPKGDFEVALFAWATSGQITSGENIYSTGRPQNRSKYSNPKVDEAFGKIASTLDESVHLEQTKIIEKELWDTLYGLPLFAHPEIIAYDSTLNNVRFTATQSKVSWNAPQWVAS